MLNQLAQWAREAGDMAMSFRQSQLHVDHKSAKDIVTEADRAIEDLLIQRIRSQYPDHEILGEERGSSGSSPHRWIIDPIDGTASFVHGQPFFSISIAYEENGVLQLGAVYAPVLGEMFLAQKGQGATCNGKAIHVSPCNIMHHAIAATGFACLRSNQTRNNLALLPTILPKLRDIRRYGSAAIDCAYVACGRLEAFWELNLHIYDIAAGLLLIQEAGGMASDFSGAPISDCQEVLVSNTHLHTSFLQALREAEGRI